MIALYLPHPPLATTTTCALVQARKQSKEQSVIIHQQRIRGCNRVMFHRGSDPTSISRPPEPRARAPRAPIWDLLLDGLGGPDFADPLLDAADANARARLARARLFLLRLLHNAQRNRWGWGWRSRFTAGSAQGAMGDAGTAGGVVVVVVGHLPAMPPLPPRPHPWNVGPAAPRFRLLFLQSIRAALAQANAGHWMDTWTPYTIHIPPYPLSPIGLALPSILPHPFTISPRRVILYSSYYLRYTHSCGVWLWAVGAWPKPKCTLLHYTSTTKPWVRVGV